jgi:hypothetical protein
LLPKAVSVSFCMVVDPTGFGTRSISIQQGKPVHD